MRTALLFCCLWLVACQAAPTEPAAARATAPLVVEDRFGDAESGLSFPLPAWVTSEVQHFDPTLPAHKFRHLIELSTSEGTAIVINVWDNPSQLPMRAWFDANMAFLLELNPEARVSQREATTDRLETLLIEAPESEQAPSLATAVFATSRRVFAITCVDADGVGSRYPRVLFEKLLAELQLEGDR